MAQMIQRGSELLRINTQKNDIEYSKDGGRTWHRRYTGSNAGTYIGDIQAAMLGHTSIYLIWRLRF